MPAVLIRQLDSLTAITEQTTIAERRQVLVEQAEMIQRASEESVPEPADRADVRRRYEALMTIYRDIVRTAPDPTGIHTKLTHGSHAGLARVWSDGQRRQGAEDATGDEPAT
jgi:hypothetical protein